MENNNNSQPVIDSNVKEAYGFLNLLTIALSFFILISNLIELIFKLTLEMMTAFEYIDNIICIVFLFDFTFRFIKSENKWHFMKWGWIDLLSSIPNINFMRIGRVVRLIRVIRIIRSIKTTTPFLQHVFKNKIQGTLTSVTIISFFMIMISSILILHYETAPNSNIKTAEDAFWFSYSTITTVGYGDIYPVTTEGRIIAIILMTVGVGLFGTFTAYVSSWFVKANQKE